MATSQPQGSTRPWGPRGLTAAQSHVGHTRVRALQASSNRMGGPFGDCHPETRGAWPVRRKPSHSQGSLLRDRRGWEAQDRSHGSGWCGKEGR